MQIYQIIFYLPGDNNRSLSREYVLDVTMYNINSQFNSIEIVLLIL